MTVCIVSHDAGGAEILASYAVQNRLDYRLVLAGPAVSVFERLMGRVTIHPLDRALAECDWCLCGTSWQSELEKLAIAEARRLCKRSIAFIDHWVNYPQRFLNQGRLELPDEIWVGDEDAHKMARKHFPHTPVRLVPNPYFTYLKDEFAKRSSSRIRTRTRVLFVCENLSGHGELRYGDPNHWGYTEFDAIEFFFCNADRLGTSIERVILRPHPSDPAGKYERLLSRHAPLAELGGRASLIDEIADCDIVAGCESMAMVAGLLAGKRVVCCVPPDQRVAFIDKRRGVEMLRDLPGNQRGDVR